MKAEERRKGILSILLAAEDAVSGTSLSEKLGASRQIIVQDIAKLKTEGYDVISTHKGYLLKTVPQKKRVLKLRHTSDQTKDELMTIVHLGGIVENVFVWHKVYGRMEAKLNIFSERSVEQFIDGIKSGKSSELMHITSGYHYHTIAAENEEVLNRIAAALEEKGYIAPELEQSIAR